MSIVRHGARMQVCCDTCPAAYPNTYEQEDFAVMVADAKAAGWIIRKLDLPPERDTTSLFGRPPRIAGPKRRPEPYTHTCPDCAGAERTSKGSLL